MGRVIELQVYARERLVADFLKKMRVERRLDYMESGTTRERVERTVNAFFFFLAYKNRVPERVGFQLGTIAFLLECEWSGKPSPGANEIAEKAFVLLTEESGTARRNTEETVESEAINVIRLFAKA